MTTTSSTVTGRQLAAADPSRRRQAAAAASAKTDHPEDHEDHRRWVEGAEVTRPDQDDPPSSAPEKACQRDEQEHERDQPFAPSPRCRADQRRQDPDGAECQGQALEIELSQEGKRRIGRRRLICGHPPEAEVRGA